MDVSEKRPHVVTGNTPNKPRGKRIRDDNGALSSEVVQQSPARRTLAFHMVRTGLEYSLKNC